MRRIRGSVSLFAAMVFLLLVSLIITTIQAARIQGGKVMVSTALSMGLDSVFAGFDKELFEEFGVLLLQGSESGNAVDKDVIAAELLGYMDYNINADKDLYFTNHTDFYGIELMGASIGSVVKPTDEGGLIWQDMVVDYEKYAKVIDLAADYMEMEEQTEEAKAVDAICTQMTIVTDKIMIVNTGTRGIVRYIDGVLCPGEGINLNEPVATGSFFKQFCPFEKTMENVNINYPTIFNAACSYMSNPLTYVESALTKNNNGESCESDLTSLKNLVASCKASLDSALVIFQEVEISQAAIDGEIALLDGLISDNSQVLQETTMEGIMEEYEVLSEYKEILVRDICDIDSMGSSLRKDQLLFNEILTIINAMDYTQTKEVINENINSIKSLINEFTLEGVCFEYSRLVTGDGDTQVLDEVSGFLEDGFLSLIIPADSTLSKRQVFETDLASSICDTYKAADIQSQGNTGTVLAKRIIYTEYVMDNFASFTDEEEGAALNYEVEYILYGNKSDADNLTAAIFTIATIRSGTNMVYLLTDSDKRNSAYMIAANLVGTAKVEPLIRAIQFTLMYLWAYAEALMDVRLLLQGEEIAIAKSDETWQLTISNLLSMNLEGEAVEQKGINYEGMLRFLMYLTDDGTKSAYTMDLVELEMIKKGRKDFRLRRYIYGMEATVSYKLAGDYSYTEKAVYTY